ncbi:MAG: dihydrolipoamide acetyltransferase family protein [Egibacteraceae bacterium]
MAMKDFLLPDLGEGLTEGEVVRWLVAVGDAVVVDQPVAEVETAKAVVEVPSPFAGTVAALHATEGDEVAVGQPLVSVEVEGQEGGAGGSGASDAGAGSNGESGSVLVGYGTGGGRGRRRRGGEQPAAVAPPGDLPRAKPPVRKMAKDLGVDLADVPASGPDGTITRDDVRAHAEGPGAPAASLDASAGETEPAPAAQGAHRDLVERIPVRGVRKLVGEKMTRSRREIPEATTWVDCDATALMELRDDLHADHPDVGITPLAIILRACVAGLREFPMLNARLDTDAREIVVQRFVNLGFAAQTDRGLVVPVIKDADRRSTLDIATELRRLARGARDGTLTPGEMTGGTFTVSNYGSFGVDGASAIINHPEVAIFGTGRISDGPWAVDGAVTVRKVMQLSISFDHRVADGGEAAGFLRYVADCVESPTRLLAAL